MGNHARSGGLRSRDIAGSVAGLVVVLVTLVALDPRVAQRFTHAASDPGEQVSTWAQWFAALGNAVLVALKDQSIDHAPWLVFTAVGVLLVLFMVRT
ncbi:MAG TPA: hypothetical protein VF136_09095 [Methylomirabilota bacterium]